MTGNVESIFDFQDQLSASVVGAIEPRLRSAEIERAERARTDNLRAYDLYLRALPHFHAYTRPDNDLGIEYIRQALDRDPTYAAAHGLLARCYGFKVAQGWSDAPSRDGALAMKAAEAAYQLNPDDADAAAILARGLAYVERRWDEAIRVATHALGLNPNSSFCWGQSGWVLTYAGRQAEAITHFERALRLSPRDSFAPETLAGFAVALIQAGQYERALDQGLEALRQCPTFTSALRPVIAASALLGRLVEAERHARRQIELEPEFSISGWRSRSGFADEAVATYLTGLRKAGLPA